MSKFLTTIVLLLCIITGTKGQHLAIKSNLLYDATTSPNLGLEYALHKQISIDVSGNYNGWEFNSGKSLKHWMVQPEVRYWVYESFNGHFFGLHGMYMDYDFKGIDLLFGMTKDYSYKGNAYGSGISYGYQLYLSPRWNVEFTAGVGYLYFKYDKFNVKDETEHIGLYEKNYFGPTKVGISFTYLLK